MKTTTKTQRTLQNTIRSLEGIYKIQLSLGEKVFLRQRISFYHEQNALAKTTYGQVLPDIEPIYDLMREYGIDMTLTRHPDYQDREEMEKFREYFRRKREDCFML
jgi:hypothetical protein